MEWYQYPAAFFAGAFLANAVPHFVQGISGNKFPTPFSNPRGIGLSSATTNMLWALFNMLAGYLLFAARLINRDHPSMLLTFFGGIMAMGLFCSKHFTRKHEA